MRHRAGLRTIARAALAVALAGCGGGNGNAPAAAELDAYCAVARHTDLEAWIGDVVTLCSPGATEGTVACSVGRVGTGGAISEIALSGLGGPGVLRALPAGDRFVLLLDDQRLVLTDGAGAIQRELAGWAGDPWISPDGSRVAWVGLPDGATAWEFGAPTVIAAQGIDEASRTVLADDAEASAPRPIPGTQDVVYVSTSTGVASLWIAGPARPAAQLTNLGLDSIGQAWVPVAGRALDFGIADSSGALFYSAADATGIDSVWRLVIGTGEVQSVGPGVWPRVRADGRVLALTSAATECAAVYNAGGTP